MIGSGRSGTTSLDRYLRQHPEVFLPAVKAPSYFYCVGRDPGLERDDALPRNFVPDRHGYEALFDSAAGFRAVGEVSPVYLAAPRVAAAIAAELPDARLVATIRDPVARLKARYVGRTRDGLERRSLDEIVRAERDRGLPSEDAFATYVAAGFVGHVLESYYEHFPPSSIHVIRADALAADPAGVMAGIFAFLGVDENVPIDVSARHNVSGGMIRGRLRRIAWTRTAGARSAVGRHLPKRVRDAAFRAFTSDLVPFDLDPELAAELRAMYRDDVLLQQRLTGLDLSDWLAPNPS